MRRIMGKKWLWAVLMAAATGQIMAGSAQASTIFYQDFNGTANVVQAQNSAWLTTPMALYGGATFSTNVPTVAGIPASAWGQSIYFPQTNGEVSYVAPAAVTSTGGIATGQSIPSLVTSSIGTFTLEYWIDALPSSTTQCVAVDVGQISDGQAVIQGKFIQPTSSGVREIYDSFFSAPNNTENAEQANYQNLNQWYHVALTYDSTTGVENLWVDATLAQTLTLATGLTTESSSLMPMEGMGTFNTTSAFTGYLDDVRLSNTVITPNDANSGWNGPIVVAPEPATLALLLVAGSVLIFPRRHRTILYAEINGTFSKVWNRGVISVWRVLR